MLAGVNLGLACVLDQQLLQMENAVEEKCHQASSQTRALHRFQTLCLQNWTLSLEVQAQNHKSGPIGSMGSRSRNKDLVLRVDLVLTGLRSLGCLCFSDG